MTSLICMCDMATWLVVGMTRCYMAPELWRGVLNKKADVFAAGCLVYFLVHGKPMWWDEMMGSKTYVSTLYVP